MSENRDAKNVSAEIDLLRKRLDEFERRGRERDQGAVARISRVGIIVGCLGGLLGDLATARALWREFFARADVEVVPADRMELSWNPSAIADR